MMSIPPSEYGQPTETYSLLSFFSKPSAPFMGTPQIYGIPYSLCSSFAAASPERDTTMLRSASEQPSTCSTVSPTAKRDIISYPSDTMCSHILSQFPLLPKSIGRSPSIFTLFLDVCSLLRSFVKRFISTVKTSEAPLS